MSQKKYKKANTLPKKPLPKRINREARKIAKTFDVADSLDTMAKKECFITLKITKKTIEPTQNTVY